MRFYLYKIGGHLQELAVLAMVFVPLDYQGLTVKQGVLLFVVCCVIMGLGIEMERRTRE
jgi:hypothetical protein